MIGTRLGSYEIVEEIGKGGMATVFRAFQPSIGRFVAVKVIHRAIAADSTALERFQREARLIARLEHPHLLPIFDYDGAFDPPYIVMRYLEGGTLKEVMDRGKLPLGDVNHIMRQVASALDYAHRQGVIHRDIKPSNIMIDQEGNAFLMDFGIARFAGGGEGLTLTGFAVGTPGYMSPEQGMGMENIDRRADIYSLGVMVFQMVTGQMPFTAETPLAVVMKHINDPVPNASQFSPGLPELLDDAIAKAMAKKPEERYNTASDFADDITRAVGKTTASLRPDALKRAAQESVDKIHQRREQKREQIEGTMAQFEASRQAPSATRPKPPGTAQVTEAKPGVMEDSPTVLTPTDQQIAQPGQPQQPSTVPPAPPPSASKRSSPLPLIAAIVAGVVVVAIILVAVLSGGGGAAETPTPDASATLDQTAIVQGLGGSATSTATHTATINTTLQATATLRPTSTPEEADTAAPTTEETREGATAVILAQTLPNETPVPPTDTPTEAPTDTPVPPTDTLVPPTEAPTDTPIPPTETPTNTPPPTSTPTPATPVALVGRALAVRSGPGSQYPQVAMVEPETPLTLLGISDDGGWYQVLLPDGTVAWLAVSAFVTTFGNIADVPIALGPTNTVPPTSTFVPTDTPAPPTETPTDTQVPPTPTETLVAATPEPTETPVPADTGRAPYLVDFEDTNPISSWDFDPSVWQVINESGEHYLAGRGSLNQVTVVRGRDAQPWLDPSVTQLLIEFQILLDPLAAGGRVVFHYGQSGYYVLEMFPGLMILKRDAPVPNVFNRDSERILRTLNNVALPANEWHRVTIWANGGTIFVYLDRALVMTVQDTISPQLSGGQILLQVNNQSRPIRFDDFLVLFPEPASTTFESASIPTEWATNNSTATTLNRDDTGQYLRFTDATIVTPQLRPLQDFIMSCRVWNDQGGYQLRLRDSASGLMLLDGVGGAMTISQWTDAGTPINNYQVPNFYNRGRWEQLMVYFVGDRLTIYRDGVVRFDETIPNSPPAGGISFSTRAGDIMRLGECMFAEVALSSNELVRPILALRQTALDRPWRLLRSDLDDNFDDVFRTDDWWVDGQQAAGTFTTDPNATDHRQFLRMVNEGTPTWRLFRDVIGVEMFRAGASIDAATDLYVTVDARFPVGTAGGTAWLAVRTTPSITGADLEGYRLELHRAGDGSTTVIVRYVGPTERTVLYEGPMPLSADGSTPEWIHLEVLSLRDLIAFFVNGQYVADVDGTAKLGGTIALGVDDGTTADFDTLIIRDTSPHDQ